MRVSTEQSAALQICRTRMLKNFFPFNVINDDVLNVDVDVYVGYSLYKCDGVCSLISLSE